MPMMTIKARGWLHLDSRVSRRRMQSSRLPQFHETAFSFGRLDPRKVTGSARSKGEKRNKMARNDCGSKQSAWRESQNCRRSAVVSGVARTTMMPSRGRLLLLRTQKTLFSEERERQREGGGAGRSSEKVV